MNKNIIFINGRIFTLDALQPTAEAIVVENGKITKVGRNIDIKPYAGRGYDQVDLNGRCVIPGMIDAHLHLLSLGLSFQRVNLDGIASLSEVQRAIAKFARTLAPGKWLLGRGWNKNLWGNDFPTRKILDPLYNGPISLSSKDGHLLWVNSAALEFCNIDKNTPEPTGGVILRDSDGAPAGILQENAVDLVFNKIPVESFDDKIQAISGAQQYLLELGITGAGDCDEDPELFSAYRELDKNRELLLRMFKMVPRKDLQAAIDSKYETGVGSEHFRIGCLKLYADGALGSQTAYMFSPYDGSQDNYGVETLTVKDIEELVNKAASHKISVAIHAIGDKANFQALTGIGKYAELLTLNNLRPRIEHAQVLRESDIELFYRYGIIASVQPIHATSDRDVADRYWGERARYAYPFKSLLERGIRLAFGSDAPIEIASPMAGIHAAVTRQKKGESRDAWYPEERLSVIEALKAYTTGASFACCYDDIVGSISPGKRADIVVLSDDIFKIPPTEIADIQVLKTVIDGEIVYQKEG